MNTRKMLFAAGLGLVAGFFIKKQVDDYQTTSPENILKKAKDAFKAEGPISGSWIYMKPETVTQHGLNYTVYRGGVTRQIDGRDVQYGFYADADTGTIIQSSQITLV